MYVWEVDVLIGQHTCDNLIALLIYLQLIVFFFHVIIGLEYRYILLINCICCGVDKVSD